MAIEGAIETQAGLGEDIIDIPEKELLTDIKTAKLFIEEAGIDAFAINIEQISLIGENKVKLNFDHLEKLKKEIGIPLVLHGGSSVYDKDIRKAIKLGIRKINIGKAVKEAYLKMLIKSCSEINDYNPYKLIGSGLEHDILIKARVSMQNSVEKLIILFGSAGKT